MAEELERIYTINLSKSLYVPRKKRASRALRLIREFAIRHMKAEGDDNVKIEPEVNEFIWRRGIEKPPRRITVKMVKDDEGVVRVSLPE